MKYRVIFLYLLLLPLPCLAQSHWSKKGDSISIVNAAVRYFDLRDSNRCSSPAKLSFSKITFYDVRYDTSFIAINWQTNNVLSEFTNYNIKYNLKECFACNLNTYFNNYYSKNFSDTTAELLCYIKSFSAALREISSKDLNNAKANIQNGKTNIVTIKMEYFYKKDEKLFPAFKIDTIRYYYFGNAKKTFDNSIKEIIEPVKKKIIELDTSLILKRNFYTQQQVTERYQSRFQLPLLTAKTYTKGIYTNFSEFINNAPSITKFTIDARRFQTGVIFYDSSNAIITSSNIFGYCDGTTCWLRHGVLYRPLIKVGNAYEVMFSGYITPLNMENGNLY